MGDANVDLAMRALAEQIRVLGIEVRKLREALIAIEKNKENEY